MRRDAIVMGTSGAEADVSVLREEACAGCSGRHVCGSAREVTIRVRNDIGARTGDTVVIEAPSGALLGYTALLFLAPGLLGVILYLLFARISAAAAYIAAAVGFVVPFIAALAIEKKTRISVPVIREVLAPSEKTSRCGCDKNTDKDNEDSGGE